MSLRNFPKAFFLAICFFATSCQGSRPYTDYPLLQQSSGCPKSTFCTLGISFLAFLGIWNTLNTANYIATDYDMDVSPLDTSEEVLLASPSFSSLPSYIDVDAEEDMSVIELRDAFEEKSEEFTYYLLDKKYKEIWISAVQDHLTQSGLPELSSLDFEDRGEEGPFVPMLVKETVYHIIDSKGLSHYMGSELLANKVTSKLVQNTDYTLRRRLFQTYVILHIDLSMLSATIDGNVDIEPYIKDALDPLLDKLEEKVDDMISACKISEDFVDACLLCDGRQEQIYTNVFDAFYVSTLTFLFCSCMCISFCFVDTNADKTICMPCVMSLKSVRETVCQGMACTVSKTLGKCEGLCNNIYGLRSIGKCCFCCLSQFPLCCDLCGQENYRLDWQSRKIQEKLSTYDNPHCCCIALASKEASEENDRAEELLEKSFSKTCIIGTKIFLFTATGFLTGYLLYRVFAPSDAIPQAIVDIVTPMIKEAYKDFEILKNATVGLPTRNETYEEIENHFKNVTLVLDLQNASILNSSIP